MDCLLIKHLSTVLFLTGWSLCGAEFVSRHPMYSIRSSVTGSASGNRTHRMLFPPDISSVRLSHGTHHCAGELETKFMKQWIPLCWDDLDTAATNMICKALSCGGVINVTGLFSLSSNGTANLTSHTGANFTRELRVMCNSTEKGLECSRGCLTKLWVTCQGAKQLRLFGGRSHCEGRVEVHDGTSWGTVCDDSWDMEDGNVVCQQLGCGFAIEVYGDAYYGKGSGPIHMDEVNCTSTETELWKCPFQKNHDCGHKEDSGVLCSESLRMLNMSDVTLSYATTTVVTLDTKGVTADPAFYSRHILLVSLCVILGVLLLIASLSLVLVVCLRNKKAVFPVLEMFNRQTTDDLPANTYQEGASIVQKTNAPSVIVTRPPEEDSDSDYEHYDFSARPPAPLMTFHNSARQKMATHALRNNNIVMAAIPEGGVKMPTPRQSQHSDGSSNISAEVYLNSSISAKAPANSSPMPLGSDHDVARSYTNLSVNCLSHSDASTLPLCHSSQPEDDSSSTSSGDEDWYENYKKPQQNGNISQNPACPSSRVRHNQREDSSTDSDYDDISALP
ncbi:T-cell differentiation antigen CD6 isoform X2 [Protopterus annectens]|uniref:T-cell differentiation antigen CD6 isoform X2 n=1 Tax=Protopterus annectens TaxID=7888 RepID=UPI001CFA2CD2|nr:T-cell differentiation antigen CD6 isoform X2 [Protopterus annectens]